MHLCKSKVHDLPARIAGTLKYHHMPVRRPQGREPVRDDDNGVDRNCDVKDQ